MRERKRVEEGEKREREGKTENYPQKKNPHFFLQVSKKKKNEKKYNFE